MRGVRNERHEHRTEHHHPDLQPERGVSQCVEHLNYPNADIIVVDDGSPVKVPCPDHVRLVRHGSSRGRAGAINTGLRKALHDTVLILDDDIYATPLMLEELASAFRKWKNRKGAIVGRVVWDPELIRTLTMDWLERHGPFRDLAEGQPRPLGSLSTETRSSGSHSCSRTVGLRKALPITGSKTLNWDSG